MAYEQDEKTHSDEEKRLFKCLVDHFQEEDKAVRERQIRGWRRLKLYWDGFTRVWFSETAHDWRVWDFTQVDDTSGDSYYYDKPVNIFKAYLESIIAALSITVPSVRCAPDDADNPLDISTAKAGNKIGELLFKHNDAPLLWLHALYIYCTEGLLASYSYPKADEAYGKTQSNRYEPDEVEQYVCNNCGQPVPDELFNERELDEYMPDDDDADLHYMLQEGDVICPNCSAMLDPNLQKTKIVVQRLVGVTSEPKTRQCVEIYGGLFVKVPNYAMKQADVPYLMFMYETHYANAIQMYPELREKIEPTRNPGTSGVSDPYERWGRLSTQYYGEYPVNNVTVRNCWFRPSAYNILKKEETESLQKKYPDGMKVVFINECFAHACNESLDDCWTLSVNPLADYLHHDPLGNLLTSVQDIVNDIISLTIQTIEHGIPQTFVDPAVVDLNAYRQQEATPGALYATKNVVANKNLGDAFFQFKAAALSEEVLPALQQFQQLGQLASGALPSLFGGMAEAGSKTASEYSMSRSQALQRLQNVWKSLTLFWKNTWAKSILSFIKEMSDDERLVERDKQGNYVNAFIRMAELKGKIGDVELEASENLPVSWAQIKDVIMRIMELNNPELLQTLFTPENIPYVKEALGLNNFVLPGEDSRQKQYDEIQQLLQSQPIEVPPPPEVMMAAQQGQPIPPEMMQPQQVPSVEVDPELDDHQIEADICKRFLISEQGRLAKIENPQGYLNVLLHFKMHMQIMQQMMMQQMQQQMAMQNAMNPQNGKGGNKGQDRNQPPNPQEPGAENGVRTPIQ